MDIAGVAFTGLIVGAVNAGIDSAPPAAGRIEPVGRMTHTEFLRTPDVRAPHELSMGDALRRAAAPKRSGS